MPGEPEKPNTIRVVPLPKWGRFPVDSYYAGRTDLAEVVGELAVSSAEAPYGAAVAATTSHAATPGEFFRALGDWLWGLLDGDPQERIRRALVDGGHVRIVVVEGNTAPYIPWEFIRDPEAINLEYLCLHPKVSIVRWVERPAEPQGVTHHALDVGLFGCQPDPALLKLKDPPNITEDLAYLRKKVPDTSQAQYVARPESDRGRQGLLLRELSSRLRSCRAAVLLAHDQLDKITEKDAKALWKLVTGVKLKCEELQQKLQVKVPGFKAGS